MEEARSQRLRMLIDNMAMKDKIFAERVGISPQYLSNLLGRRKMLTYEMVEKITRRYNRVNKAWLLSGEGEMYLPDPAAGPAEPMFVQEPAVNYPGGTVRVLITPLSSDAVYHTGWPREWQHPPRQLDAAEYIRIGQSQPEGRLYRIQTNRLAPLIEPGDWVSCQAVEISNVKSGEIYIAVTRSGIVLKKAVMVRPGDRIFFSTGKPNDSNFTEIAFDEILQLWHVQARITGTFVTG